MTAKSPLALLTGIFFHPQQVFEPAAEDPPPLGIFSHPQQVFEPAAEDMPPPGRVFPGCAS